MEETCIFFQNQIFPGVVNSEVQSPIYENTWNRNGKPSIKPPNSFCPICFSQAVIETLELSLLWRFSQIDSESRPCEIKRMHEKGCEGSCKTSIQDLNAQIMYLL